MSSTTPVFQHLRRENIPGQLAIKLFSKHSKLCECRKNTFEMQHINTTEAAVHLIYPVNKELVR